MGKISNKTNNNKGFTLVEVLLLIVVLILVGGLGYLGYKQVNKKSTTSTSSTNTTTTKTDTPATTLVKDETANWLTYAPESNAYSIRIPDGWQLHYLSKENGGSGDPYSWVSKELSYKAGTKATVVQDGGGRDGSYIPFRIDSDPKDVIIQGAQESQYKTASGMDATKYVYVQGSMQEGMAPPVGTKIYVWRITQGTKSIIVTHGFITGDVDNSALVEKMINTIKLN